MTTKEREYRAVEAFHYSLLSKLDQDPRRVISEEDPTKYMNFGSVSDKLQFERFDFFNEFYIMDFTPPSDTMKEIVDKVWEKVKGNKEIKELENYPEAILEAAGEAGYGKGKYKDERVIKDVTSKGNKYFEKLAEIGDRRVITNEEYVEATRIVEMLKYHDFTEKIFAAEEGLTKMAQVPIYHNMEGVDCKILLDWLITDDKNRVLYPFDMKVMSQDKFMNDFIKYRYYLQAAFYSDVLQAANPHYTVAPFEFVIARRGNPNNPLRYRCSAHDLSIGREGGYYRGRKVKGYKQLIEEYQWHKSKDLWDDPKEIYDREGIMKLDVFDKQVKHEEEPVDVSF